MAVCPRCECEFDIDWVPGECPVCGLPYTVDQVGETWSGDEYPVPVWGDDAPAWVLRMEKADDREGYHCSGFEANMVAKEWRSMKAELSRLTNLQNEWWQDHPGSESGKGEVSDETKN